MRPSSIIMAGLLASLTLSVSASEETTWRLFVADHSEPVVSAIDLASGEPIASFGLSSPASLYTTSTGAAVFAVQGEAGRVVPVSTGIVVEDHGDHGDISISEPGLIEAAIEGDRPVHFVEHDGHIAIFFDGEGVARIVEEHEWLEGTPTVREVSVAAPHHGVAVQLGDHVLMSEPHPQDPTQLPVGVQVLDKEGNKVGGVHECPDLHGEASSGDILAIACGTGLLVVKEGAAGPDVQFLPYAEDLPEGKTTTLLGGVGLQYFLGNYGADKVVLIDPAVPDAFRLVDLPTRRVHFAIDPQNVKFAYVFTEDGQLRELNVVSGALSRAVQVTDPYSMDGEWNLPRPRIAVAGGVVAVTDPLASTIHIVDTASFEIARTIPLDGSPFNIVAVGGSGQTHN